MARGTSRFKTAHPDAVVEYNADIRIPEVLSPDVQRPKFSWLSAPSKGSRPNVLKNFIKQNTELVGVNNDQVDGLEVSAD